MLPAITHTVLSIHTYLRSSSQKEFYLEGSKFGDMMCFSCHKEKERFTERITVKATNFRNGELNLHFIHTQGKKEEHV